MKTLFALALLGLLAVAFFWERNAMDGLRAQNESLRAEKLEAEQLAAENRDLPELRATASPAPRSDRTELLRLRNDVRRLRAQQQEAEKLRAANQRVADEIKSGKFAPRRLADMEGFVARENWAFVGFATPEAAVQSFLAAVISGDLGQVIRCGTPEHGEELRQEHRNDPERFGQQFTKTRGMFASVSGFRIAERRQISDDQVELELQFIADRETLSLKFRRLGAEWKLDK